MEYEDDIMTILTRVWCCYIANSFTRSLALVQWIGSNQTAQLLSQALCTF